MDDPLDEVDIQRCTFYIVDENKYLLTYQNERASLFLYYLEVCSIVEIR